LLVHHVHYFIHIRYVNGRANDGRWLYIIEDLKRKSIRHVNGRVMTENISASKWRRRKLILLTLDSAHANFLVSVSIE